MISGFWDLRFRRNHETLSQQGRYQEHIGFDTVAGPSSTSFMTSSTLPAAPSRLSVTSLDVCLRPRLHQFRPQLWFLTSSNPSLASSSLSDYVLEIVCLRARNALLTSSILSVTVLRFRYPVAQIRIRLLQYRMELRPAITVVLFDTGFWRTSLERVLLSPFVGLSFGTWVAIG